VQNASRTHRARSAFDGESYPVMSPAHKAENREPAPFLAAWALSSTLASSSSGMLDLCADGPCCCMVCEELKIALWKAVSASYRASIVHGVSGTCHPVIVKNRA